MNNNSKKVKEIIWNAVGAGLSACQAAILLIFIARVQPIETAGIVTISFAVANIIFAISKYGVRNFQVTDINEEYSFGDYFYNRIGTSILSVVIAIAFLSYSGFSGEYSVNKILIMSEIICLRVIDGMEDVYLGHFQLKDHFLDGARVLAIKKIVVTFVMCMLVVLFIDISVVGLIAVIVSIASDIILISRIYIKAGGTKIGSINYKAVKELFIKCFPLAVGTTLSIYVGNIPKYVIDMYMTEELQAIFGYIMLPVFVMTLLNQFIYTPFVKDFGVCWTEKRIDEFKNKILMHCGIIVGLSLVFIGILILAGLPLIGIIYNIDLSMYRAEYIVLLLGGCVYAIAFYLIIPLTAMRCQNYIAVGYIIISAISILAGRTFVDIAGLMGVAVMYTAINIILIIMYGTLSAIKIATAKKRIN